MVLDALGLEARAFRGALARIVPLAEAGLGLWLLSGWSAVFSGAAAAVVLLGFTAVLLKLQRQGYTGTCGCFVTSRGRVGSMAIVRNLVLVALCLLVATASSVAQEAFDSTPSFVRPSTMLVAMSIVVPLVLYVSLASHFSTIAVPTPAPSVPSRLVGHVETEIADRVEMLDLAGARIVLGRPKARSQLVVFAMGRCPGCRRDRDILNRLDIRGSNCEVVIVCGGKLAETYEFASDVRPPVRIVADPQWQAARAWKGPTTPFSVFLDQEGRVRSRGELTDALSLLDSEHI